MKIFDLYIRILKKQLWAFALYFLAFCGLMIIPGIWYGDAFGMEGGLYTFYQYVVVIVFVLVLLAVSAVTSVTSDSHMLMRHRAAPIRVEILEMQYLGANGLVMLFIWMFFFWTAVILYGEEAYGPSGLFYAGNLLAISLLALSLGNFLGMLVKTRQGRWIGANVIAFALPLAGGSFWGAGREEGALYLLSSFTPVFWYQRAMEEINKANGTLKNYLIFIGIQAIYAGAALVFGMMIMKQKKSEEFI